MMYYLYILECKDASLYTGITTDVKRRLKEHQGFMGGHYTRSHGAVQILYTEKLRTRSAALKREYAIKRLSRKEKLELTRGLR